MKDRKTYPLFKAHVDIDQAMIMMREVLESGFINEGFQVVELTKQMSKRLRSERLILVNSCTSALTMALKLAGVGVGDDVVATSMTCVASNMPIKHLGANIVWTDVDPDNGMPGVEELKKAITPKTKAVMLVLWAGNAYDIESIQNLCQEMNVKLIIDAAHAFMSNYDRRPVHAFADFTCYSFQAIKHITTGDGGALVCKSQSDFEASKRMKWFGLDRDRAKDSNGNWKGQQWDIDIEDVGYKFNMNNLSAALGLSQMKYTDWIIDRHRSNAATYAEMFDATFRQNVSAKPIKKDPRATGSEWVYTIVLSDELSSKRDALLERLNEEGIHAGVVHVPNHNYTVFAGECIDLPGVDRFFSRQLSLPCGWWLKKRDIEHIFNRLTYHIQKLQESV